MSSFADLNLHERLIKALGELEITTPTPVQTAAIPAALEGRDLRVVARTGSGKTAAFLLPMLHQLLQYSRPRTDTRALILLPTRELAQQGMAPALSYQVKLIGNKLVWATEDNGQRHMLTSEPGGIWRRLNAWISKAVGLEKML